jgi:hypothetical protein
MELVTAGIREQITDLAVPETRAASSLEELSARVSGFRLPPGPADVTSIHDFHQLQVAFQHIWTEAFDENLRERVEALYAIVAELHDDYGGTFALPAEAGEIDEIAAILRDATRDVETLQVEAVPSAVAGRWEEAEVRWHLLSERQQAELTSLADEWWRERYNFSISEEERTTRKNEIIESGSRILQNPGGRLGRLVRLRDEIAKSLTTPFAFHYFAPNSVNYGLLFTYRQAWQPITYQVGDLVSTLPLAPGEIRRYSSKVVRKMSRAEKELERSISSRRGESSETRRAEGEITGRASIATNFKQTAEGSFSIGLVSIGSTTEFALNQAQESARAKKDFREAVIRAAEEYRRERSVEVQSSSEMTAEESSSGEVRNPNNEVTVTYLFYELERRYRISERLHRVTPVILIAQDVPAPNEITEAWLLQHAWIIRRVVLDDSLRPALDYLSDGFAGNELSVNLLRAAWEKQRALVSKLEADMESHRNRRDALRGELVATERSIGELEAGGRSDASEAMAAIFTGGLSLFRPDRTEEQIERLEVARKAIEMNLDHLNEMIRETESRLSRGADAFAAATKEYQRALESQSNRRLQVDQLRVHVKENILYYNDPEIRSDAELRNALISLIENRIRTPVRESDVIVVPSGQLYIEALVGRHPLLENFKLAHRAMDMAKARAELREEELENLRRAARMLKSEPDFTDPEVDRRVQVEGNAGLLVGTE